ncbi:unnamed protein product, partial [Rotaria socialis]
SPLTRDNGETIHSNDDAFATDDDDDDDDDDDKEKIGNRM